MYDKIWQTSIRRPSKYFPNFSWPHQKPSKIPKGKSIFGFTNPHSPQRIFVFPSLSESSNFSHIFLPISTKWSPSATIVVNEIAPPFDHSIKKTTSCLVLQKICFIFIMKRICNIFYLMNGPHVTFVIFIDLFVKNGYLKLSNNKKIIRN